MANLTEPDEILKHFLAAEVGEVTRTTPSFSNRQTNDTESFNGTGSKTEFVITDSNPIVCINEVTVGGVTQSPYLDYQIDLDNKTVTFTVAPASGTDNVVIDYDYGSHWVFPDKPRDDLSKSSYPRIGVTLITESGDPNGASENDTFDQVVFQIDVVTSKDLLCTIDTEIKEGQDVTTYIARQVVSKIKSRWRAQLFNELFDPRIINNFNQPFEEDKGVFRRIVEVQFSTNNTGE